MTTDLFDSRFDRAVSSFGKNQWYQDLFFSVLTIGSYLLCTLIISYYGTLLANLMNWPAPDGVLSSLCGSLLALLVMVILKRKHRWYSVVSRHSRGVFEYCVYLALIAAVWVVGCILATVINSFGDNQYSQYTNTLSSADIYIRYLYTLLIAPICEEMLIHDTIYRGLRREHTVLFSAFVASFLFGAMHFTAVQIPLTFLMSMMFCLVYERTGDVRLCAIFHSLVNCMSTFLVTHVRFPGIVFNLAVIIPLYLLVLSVIVMLLVYLPRRMLFASRFADRMERR